MKRIHFFFNSKLIENFGGVETWADYFFPILNEISNYQIFIYYVDDKDDNEKKLFEKWEFKKNINLCPININKPSTNFFLLNYLLYSWRISSYLKKMSFNDHTKDYYIYIGSIMSGFVNKYLNIINLNYKKGKKIVWVRSKSVGEISGNSQSIKFEVAKILEKSIVKQSDLVITNGEDTKNYYKQRYSGILKEIECIPNVIKENFTDLPIRKTNINKLIIVYSGRLDITKGFDYFEEISMINNKKFSFVAYGDDSKVQKKYDTITYYGKYKKEDLIAIFERGHIFLFLNISDMSGGLSHSLIEAMSAGKIIVAWDNDVHNQVLNNENSWLVPERDLELLEKTVLNIYEKCINNDEEIYRKRLQARKDSKEYTPDKHVKKFIDTINKL